MPETKNYAVLGSGMQGTAAAYDLAKFGSAARIVVADSDFGRAQISAERVNELVGRHICRAAAIDASDASSVQEALAGVDCGLSCVPYPLHAGIEHAALEIGVSCVDMGNDTDVTLETLKLNEKAIQKGVTIVPDTGLAPGLVNSIGAWFIQEMDTVESVKLYCGGLPQHPKPPFNYSLRFSIVGLVGEYVDVAIALRDGEVVRLETLTELEAVEIPGLGAMEAFTTSSGTSTAPYTWKGRVQNYEYKTLRHPGHCELMKMFQLTGFWNDEPVQVGDHSVSPFDVFCAVMGPKLADPNDKDLVATRGVGLGTKNGKPCTMSVDILDYQDDATGFTAMERLTGFSTSIHAIEVAHGRVRKGVVPYETAMSGEQFLNEVERRGIQVRRQVVEG